MRGVNVRGVELQDAACTLAKDLGIKDFTVSSRWLWRFRHRHALGNRFSRGESVSADKDSVGAF